MFVVNVEPAVKIKEPGLPEVVLAILACNGVIIEKFPLTVPVLVAAIANTILPVVDVIETLQPAAIKKSSPASPAIVIVVVPVVLRTKLAVTPFTNFTCAQVMPAFACTVIGPVTGVAPPKLVPSNTRMSVAPVEDGREEPEP